MLKKIAHWYLKLVEAVCVFMLIVILGCMCIQIGCRLLSVGQSFTEELAKLCFSVMIFIGAPLAMAEGADICVDMLVNAMPAGVRRVVEALGNVLVAVFACVAIKGFTVFIKANKGVTAVSMTWIKMNWLYCAFLVSFGLLALVAVVKAVCAVLGKPQTLDINAEAKKKAAEAEKELNLDL